MDFNEINLIVKYAHTISRLAIQLKETDTIPPELYDKYDVKRGLRDKNGKGVMCGLTEISEVTSWKTIDGVRTPVPGELRYRGYDVKDLIANCERENRFGFEETVYLLLFGKLKLCARRNNEADLQGYDEYACALRFKPLQLRPRPRQRYGKQRTEAELTAYSGISYDSGVLAQGIQIL